MGDFKANRYFEIEDYEASDRTAPDGSPVPVTFRLHVTDIYVPDGVEDYDIEVVLKDMIDASGFGLGVKEIPGGWYTTSTGKHAKPDADNATGFDTSVTNSITGQVSGTCIQAGDISGNVSLGQKS